MFKKLLVASDGSALSGKAVRCAIELALVHEGQLLVVNVVPRYPMSCFEGAASFSAEEIGAVGARCSQESRELLDSIAHQAGAAGVKARTCAIGSDSVAKALLATAKKHRCDLIVMASHGRRGIKRLLLGSETQQVLAHTTLPVLVLR